MSNVIHKPRDYWAAGSNRIREVFRLAYLFATELSAAGAVEIIVRPVKSRRTLEQNAKLWAMLGDISRQVDWPVNGVMQQLDSEDWKALMDAEYRIDQGNVWTENGWMYAGLSQQGQMKALEILREATKLKLNNHSYIHQYHGPKITKPTPPNKPSEPIVRRVVNEKVINANEVKP